MANPRLPLLAATIASVALFGCSSSGKTMIEKEFADLHAEMQKIQADQRGMADRLEAMERERRAQPAGSAAPDAAKGDKPPLKVVVLTPTGADQPDETVDADEGAPTPVTARGGKSDTGGKKGNPDRDYEQAMKHVKSKSWDKVLDAFTAFLVRYPDGDRADNAMFWIGEAYAQKGEDDKAIEQLAGLVARFPRGNKAPDALLKQAMLHKKAGRADKAKELLQELKKKYPSSDASKRAPAE